MAPLRASIACVLCLAACGAAPLERRLGAVRNGEDDAAHPNAMLLVSGGRGYCTATLIGRQTALTAAHCLLEPTEMELAPTRYSRPEARYQLTSGWPHPLYDPDTARNDIAILHLARRAYGVVPSPVADEPPAAGDAITVVGFGSIDRTTGVDFGDRRSGVVTIQSVTPDGFAMMQAAMSDPTLCPGDSGGPSFSFSSPERIVGVHSLGECYPDQLNWAYDARPDAVLDWITAEAEGDLYLGGPIDVTPPKVKFVAPAFTQVDLSFAAEVEITDDGPIATAEIFLDGVSRGTAAAAPWRFSLSDVAAGTHVLRAVATDAEGNAAEASLTLAVAARAPLDAACMEAGDCASHDCDRATRRCVQRCTEATTCPDGTSCDEGLCRLDDAGCATAPGPRGAPRSGLLLAALALGLAVARRRARA